MGPGDVRPSDSPAIVEIEIADPPEAWARLGFDVVDGSCRVGEVLLRLGEREGASGLTSWSLHGVSTTCLDGLPTRVAAEPPREEAGRHPNGTVALDHVVAFTPALERTTETLRAAGLDLRRIREGPTPGGAMRQAFFRLGKVVLEVIEHPPGTPASADLSAPARLWGLAFLVDDIDECAERLGADLGGPRAAIQPGRQIAPVRRSAGLSVPVAFITPAGDPSARPAS